ncbi:MAG: putative sulfate/molybdate transporter [Candidatus Hadarchaeota archaeon]
MRFTLEEFSGAFGDSITVIPLLVGIALTTGAELAHLLLFFGIFQIVAGLYFRLPMPIEPMKALAALAIAGSLSYSEVTTAGIVLGVMLLASGGLGLMGRLDEFVPTGVVRGIQLGLAFILSSAVSRLVKSCERCSREKTRVPTVSPSASRPESEIKNSQRTAKLKKT